MVLTSAREPSRKLNPEQKSPQRAAALIRRRKEMKRLAGSFGMILGALLAASPAVYAQATLVKTIDLKTWTGVPVSTVQPPIPVPSNVIVAPSYVQVPQPAPGSAFSLTGIAVDPVSNTIYVADHASSNVYLIDGATNTVSSAAYTYPLSGNIDGVPPALSGTAGNVVTTVVANPVTNRWLFMGEFGGAQFSGTTFAEAVVGQAMQSGGAWDPVTGNVYGATGDALHVTQGLKWLNFALSSCNTTALNPMTLRVYTSCILGYSGSGLAQIPNYGIVGVDGGSPDMQTRIGRGPRPASWYTLQNANAQPTGLAVNANTNLLYVAAATSPTSLDVIDLSTNAIVASIPGLPDQSSDYLVGGIYPLPLPRPIAVNALTNTIFVVNSVSSTISVFDGNTNTLKGTIAIPVPDGAIVNVPVPPSVIIQEFKTGNTYFSRAITAPNSVGTLTSLGGAVAIAVNESTNMLYVASVNGTISVFALDPPAGPAAFSINGTIKNAQGVPAAGVTVKAGTATAVTDAAGLFVLTGLPTGTYTVTPASASFSFGPASLSVTVNGRNLGGLAFQANPPIVPASYTLSPWTMIGAGVTTTGTVTLNQPAPAGGAVLTLAASDPKAAKVPSTVTVSAGQSSISFPVQGSGVSAVTNVTLTAVYNGGTASASLTVAPGDSLKITKATYSTSTQMLTVSATGTNAQATLNVFLSSTNQLLGTMVNQGGGNYSFSQSLLTGAPASVSVVSNLGGKTGQGVTVAP
jgi:DNA-binding beta-propeller fold protein YncE